MRLSTARIILTIIIVAAVTQIAIVVYQHPKQITLDIPHGLAVGTLHEGINKLKDKGVELTVIIGKNPNIVDD